MARPLRSPSRMINSTSLSATDPAPQNTDIDEWYRHHAASVLRVCRRHVSDTMIAEDLAQEIFLKVSDTQAVFRGQSQPSTWIHRVAVNHCIDYLRRRNRRRELLEQFGSEIHPHPDDDYENAESPTLNLLRKSLNELDSGWKQIVFMRYDVGLTHGQIAEICGLSRVAITRRLGRFQRGLEKKLRANRCLPDTV